MAFRASGLERVESSVTNITESPSRTAKVTASSDTFRIRSSVHPSAYCRTGELPMKVHASMGIPTACEISTMGRTSATTVRAAQLAEMDSPESWISLARAVTSATARGPAPGRPISAVSIPSSSIRFSSRSFSPMGGSTTEGFCRPSRRVSSSSWMVPIEDQSKVPSSVFQS
jgi:hypothetical protein